MSSGYRVSLIQILESFDYPEKLKLRYEGNWSCVKSMKLSVIADFILLNKFKITVEFFVYGSFKILKGSEFIKDIIPTLKAIESIYMIEKVKLDLEKKAEKTVNIQELRKEYSWFIIQEILAKFFDVNVFSIPVKDVEFEAFLQGLGNKKLLQVRDKLKECQDAGRVYEVA